MHTLLQNQQLTIKQNNNFAKEKLIIPSLSPLKMNEAFQHYEHLRKQQIHYSKIINPQLNVPKHQAYKPLKPKIQQTRLKQRLKKQAFIQHQNIHIMKKLFDINMRKPHNHSLSTKTLPPVILKKKSFQIPQHQRQNNNIALRLINTKSSINVKSQLKDYHQKQKLKKNLSKYQNVDGQNGLELIDRKKYIAELMLMKKLKLAETTQSRLKNYIAANPSNSRLTKISEERQRSQTIKT